MNDNHNIQLASHDTCRDVRKENRRNNITGNIEVELMSE